MKRYDRAWRGAGRTASLLAVAAACCGAMPQQALAAEVRAYIIFEIADSSDASAATQKLRSTSLVDCKQLIVGQLLKDVFVQIACAEVGDPSLSLNRALSTLSGVDGIARATVVSLKRVGQP